MENGSLETTEFATNWQRDGCLKVEAKQVRPNTSTPSTLIPATPVALFGPANAR